MSAIILSNIMSVVIVWSVLCHKTQLSSPPVIISTECKNLVMKQTSCGSTQLIMNHISQSSHTWRITTPVSGSCLQISAQHSWDWLELSELEELIGHWASSNNRPQTVWIGSHTSSTSQGCVLSPHLFTPISAASNSQTQNSSVMYADDTSIISHSTHYNEVQIRRKSSLAETTVCSTKPKSWLLTSQTKEAKTHSLVCISGAEVNNFMFPGLHIKD